MYLSGVRWRRRGMVWKGRERGQLFCQEEPPKSVLGLGLSSPAPSDTGGKD